MAKKIVKERTLESAESLIEQYAQVILTSFVLSVADRAGVESLAGAKSLEKAYKIACNLLRSDELPESAKKLIRVTIALSRYGFDCRAMPEKREFERLQGGGPVAQPQPKAKFIGGFSIR